MVERRYITPPTSSGIPTLLGYVSPVGFTYAATGTRIYPWDSGYGAPQIVSTDDTIVTGDTDTGLNGSPVWGARLLAQGTYEFKMTFESRAVDAGVTDALVGVSALGGVGPSTWFQGKYGRDPHDGWEGQAGAAEFFYNGVFVVRAGTTAFITPDVILSPNAGGDVVARVGMLVTQLSPVDLGAIT